MITVANRATPKAPTLEQQKNAMTSEGAPPEGQMSEPPPPAHPSTAPATQPTPSKPHNIPDGVPGAR